VKSLVREGKSQQILNLMQTGKQYGMTTLEDELLRAYADGLITADDAISKANRPDDVRRRVPEIRVKAPEAGVRQASPGAGGAAGGNGLMGVGAGSGSGFGAAPRAAAPAG